MKNIIIITAALLLSFSLSAMETDLEITTVHAYENIESISTQRGYQELPNDSQMNVEFSDSSPMDRRSAISFEEDSISAAATE